MMQRMIGSTIFLFSSFALGVIGFIAACKDEGCVDKCLANCRRKCKFTYFAQLSPCSYACILDNLYSYHNEPNFKQCGTDRVCYEGQCLCTNYTEKCKKVYGKDYIGIENPKETCTFTCISQSECYKTYKENISDGTKCLADHSGEQGTCRAGICVVKRRIVSHPITDYLKHTLNLPRLIAGSIIGAEFLSSAGVHSRSNGRQTIDGAKEAKLSANTSLKVGIDADVSLGVDSNSTIGMETNSEKDSGAFVDTDDSTVEINETTITEAGVGFEEKAKGQADEQAEIGKGVATGGNVKNIAELIRGTEEVNDEVEVDVNAGVNGDTLVETDLEITADENGSPAQERDSETEAEDRRKTKSGVNQDEKYAHKTKQEADVEEQGDTTSRISEGILTSDAKEEEIQSEILKETSIEKSIDGSISDEISESISASIDEADSGAIAGDSEGILKSVFGNTFSEDSELESGSIEGTDSGATGEDSEGILESVLGNTFSENSDLESGSIEGTYSGATGEEDLEEESKSISGSVDEGQEDRTSRISEGIFTSDTEEEAIESEILEETSIEKSIEGSISDEISKSISVSNDENDSDTTGGEDSGEESKSISGSVDVGSSSEILKSKSGSINGAASDVTVKKISEEISDLVSVLIEDGHSREISKSAPESRDDAFSNYTESEILEDNSTAEKIINTVLEKENVTLSGVTVRHALGRIEILDSEGNILEVIKTFTVNAPSTISERGSSDETGTYAGGGYEANSTITKNSKIDEINRSVAGRGSDRAHEKVVVVRVSGVGEEPITATTNEDDVDGLGDDGENESGIIAGSGSDRGRGIYSEK